VTGQWDHWDIEKAKKNHWPREEKGTNVHDKGLE